MEKSGLNFTFESFANLAQSLFLFFLVYYYIFGVYVIKLLFPVFSGDGKAIVHVQ